MSARVCPDCSEPTRRGPRAVYCPRCARRRVVASHRAATTRYERTEKAREKRLRRYVHKEPGACVRCKERPARTNRAMHCAPCRRELHRIYSREYRRSPRGKTKLAEWHRRHPGYATRESARRRGRVGRPVARIAKCQALLCGNTFVQSRNGQQKWCDTCAAAFHGATYPRRRTTYVKTRELRRAA